MTAKPGTRKSLLDPTEVRGIRVHNLVLSKDHGNDYAEFRVQCEIHLPKYPNSDDNAKERASRDVQTILAALTNPTPDALRDVESIVTPYIQDGASKNFRDAVHLGFLDSIESLKQGTKPNG